MSKQREALEKALDTLRGWIGIDEWIWPVTAKETCKKNSLEAITAIREALAEPEPWTPDDMAYRPGGLSMTDRKPLTDDEIDALADVIPGDTIDSVNSTWHIRLARAIEKAHGINEQ